VQIVLICLTIVLAILVGIVLYSYDQRRSRDISLVQETNRKLDAANQQLRATEQQLRAANQQLHADEQQLSASNQQLRANEQALREKEERLRLMFENMFNAIAMYCAVDDGADFIIKDFNKAAETIERVRREDIIGKRASEVFPGVKEFGILEAFGRVWRSGEAEHFPLGFYKDERITGWRDNYIFKLPTGEVVAAYSDETERKQAEQNLRESEERFRTMFEEGPIGMALSGKDFHFIRANAAFCKMMGYAEEEIKTLTFKNITHSEHLTQDVESVNKVLKGDIPLFRTEKRYLRKGGEIIWGAATIAAVRQKNGEFLHFIVMVEDITQRKRIESELFKTQRLESLGILAGGIAHDFNNLLGGVFGFVDMAREYGKADEQISYYLGRAMEGFHSAKALTQQLLTFSKGGMPVKNTISLARSLRESASLALSGSNVHCRFDIADDLWLVDIDENQIGQVIRNLVINARQAMGGGGTVKVSGANRVIDAAASLPLKPGRYVEVAVTDTGIGIPPEHLSHIFDPFFTTKQEGSGLGLAISYSIVKKHEGHIAVESSLGKGTTFRLYLPVSKSAAADLAAEESEIIRGHGRIIVMDDEKLVLEMAMEMLGHLGYEPVACAKGEEVVERYRNAQEKGKRYEAVILDLTVVGGMGGEKTLEQLKAIDPHVRAIVSSGYSDDRVLSQYREYGFCAAVSKPYTIKELGKVLAQALAKQA
jgi:PAS domain S-box-containing protein